MESYLKTGEFGGTGGRGGGESEVLGGGGIWLVLNGMSRGRGDAHGERREEAATYRQWVDVTALQLIDGKGGVEYSLILIVARFLQI